MPIFIMHENLHIYGDGRCHLEKGRKKRRKTASTIGIGVNFFYSKKTAPMLDRPLAVIVKKEKTKLNGETQ